MKVEVEIDEELLEQARGYLKKLREVDEGKFAEQEKILGQKVSFALLSRLSGTFASLGLEITKQVDADLGEKAERRFFPTLLKRKKDT